LICGYSRSGSFGRRAVVEHPGARVMISEYGEWLGSQTNRHGRPFQAESISAYRDAAVALSAWMTSAGLEADFTGCDTAALNRFFRGYLASHSQGGTNTKQRNL
jgi:integrase/recombinase XerD